MKIIELYKYAQIKIGFEKNLYLTPAKTNKLNYRLDAHSHDTLKNNIITAELLLPANNSYYALLGAEFAPTATKDFLCLEIFYTDKFTSNFPQSIAFTKETVKTGLPYEYASKVLESSIDFFSNNVMFPAGLLSFNMAAICDVGSSEWIFSTITKILLDLFINHNQIDSDEYVKSMCMKYLRPRVIINH
jgi:hypothetical protein